MNEAETDSLILQIPFELLLLLCAVGLLIFLWDLFDRRSSSLQEDSGFDEDAEIIGVRGSAELPSPQLNSTKLGLSSRPDAVLREEGFLIPVDVVPMSSKVQDRHIVKLLVHLKLIEEQEGKPSPYGILRMGQKGRIVRVRNTEEKQRWLETLLDEMHSIISGVPAVPAPSFKKCKACEVNSLCDHSLYKSKQS